jgi:hypothetical protein
MHEEGLNAPAPRPARGAAGRAAARLLGACLAAAVLPLVYNNSILNGSVYPNCHNMGPYPTDFRWHMQEDGDSAMNQLDLGEDRRWKDVNLEYLTFILPKG